MKCNIISEAKENLGKLGHVEIKFRFSIGKKNLHEHNSTNN